MDEFAQTRQPDDLFDDDFTPIPENHSQPRQHGRPQGPKAPPKSPSQKLQQPPPPKTQQQPQPLTDTTSIANDDAPPSPEQAPKPTPAVRGDRSATGGINKPKLTEDELSARLAAARLNNAKREEAHRLAEADEASFQQREAQAQQKRREEGAARRVMDQEREKNRLRKLAVKGGREWDEGKEEVDVRAERASGFRRGAYGGVTLQNYGQEGQDDDLGQQRYSRGRGRGRGRGERGRGGRVGGGRGPQVNGIKESQAVPRDEDFPTLSAASAPSKPIMSDQTSESPMVPAGEKQSWADQVEKDEPSGGW